MVESRPDIEMQQQPSAPINSPPPPMIFCKCSQSVTQANIHEHMAMCKHFQDDYASIYQALGRCHEQIMSKPILSQQKLAALSLKNMLAIFTTELDTIIKKDNNQANHYQGPHVVNHGQGPHVVHQQPMVLKDPHEPPMPESPLPLLGKASSGFDMNLDDQAMAEQMRLLEQIKRQNEVDSCKFCDRPIDQGDASVMLQSTDCFHTVHTECFKTRAKVALKDNNTLTCPECHKSVAVFEIKTYLDPEEIKEIEKAQFDQFLGGASNMAKCPCGNVMEAAQGQVDYNSKDDKGQVMSPGACIHMSKYRMRCRSCQQNFCHGCSVTPYHAGKNCEEYKRHLTSKKCRFCGEELVNQGDEEVKGGEGAQGAFNDICLRQECQDMIRENCDKVHACGHPCRGFFGEIECLPCLNADCAKQAHDIAVAAGDANNQALLHEGVNEDEYCTICWISGLGTEPCVKLGCRHVFHLKCVKQIIETRWTSPRIVFAFMNCPSCKQAMQLEHCAPLQAELAKVREIKTIIESKSVERAKLEGLDKHERLRDPNDRFYGDLNNFAMFKCAFYMCFKCKNPYFGGMNDCGDDMAAAGEYRKEDLVCPKCSADLVGAGVKNCKKHGADYIDFKCKWCCSISLWFCHGNTHYCDPCHRIAGRNKPTNCAGQASCPLKLDHPPAGEEFALGCGLCRSNKYVDV